jgi:hypothetical protein
MMRRLIMLACLLELCGSGALAAERSYTLPCAAQTIAPSADGKYVWFTCRTGAKWEQYQKEVAEAQKQGKEGPTYGTNVFQDALYLLDLGGGKATKLAESTAAIEAHPAPRGARAVVTFPRERAHDRATLYDGATKRSDLPIDPSFLLWSPDASRLYFYGGSTVQADAWNIMGVLDLGTMKAEHRRLRRPSEGLYACPRDGHLFTGSPLVDGKADIPTDEYDPALTFQAKSSRFPGGYFSAHCTYVATEDSFHGPLPWEVVETASGKKVLHTEFSGDVQKGEYEFRGWNPQREPVLLRAGYLADERLQVEAFDVAQQRVVLSSTEKGPLAWSADGDAVIVGRGNVLVLLLVPK